MPLPPDPVAFTIPFLGREVYWYGILVTLGTLAGAFVADRMARRKGHNPDHIWNALIVVMILGLIGARLYHVVWSPASSATNLQHYLENPIEIVNFWGESGGLRGLGIFGAVAGGVVGLWLYTRWAKLDFAEWADIAAVGVPLGQAIGRWGNYFNQELYGRQTGLPWGIPVAREHRLPEFAGLPESARFHPTFLYESLWNLLVFFVLMYIARHWEDRLRDGDVALLYLILYPLGRYFAEVQRPDAWTAGGIPVAQIVSVLTMLAAALWLLARHDVFRLLRRRAQEA
jgi:phosphatidylglycerol:prolipoprotein diacylglycerol transferase